MNYSPERLGLLRAGELSVYEETAELKTALAWGPVGIEGILNLFVDPKESLFFGEMNIPGARSQFDEMQNLLESEGVNLVRVRDLLAMRLMSSDMQPRVSNLKRMEEMISCRGLELYAKYGYGDTSVLDWVGPILAEDASRYGSERTAILLNQMLLNEGGLPVANIMFGRDQSTVVGSTIVWSKMRHEIRQPEIAIWKYALADYLSGTRQIEIKGTGTIEGGDTIINGGICYIGVGGRTNQEGVFQAASQVLDQGLRVMMVYNDQRDRGEIEHQTTMHLDTFSMPLPNDTWVVYPEEASSRRVIEISKCETGGYEYVDLGDFLSHLIRERGQKIIPVSREQQLGYQTNFVNLGRNRVMVTLNGDGYLIGEMQKRGLVVYDADLSDITQGYGGGHCSIAGIVRG